MLGRRRGLADEVNVSHLGRRDRPPSGSAAADILGAMALFGVCDPDVWVEAPCLAPSSAIPRAIHSSHQSCARRPPAGEAAVAWEVAVE